MKKINEYFNIKSLFICSKLKLMDTLEKELIIGKYYQIPSLDKVQYIGKANDTNYFTFVRKNFFGLKYIIIRRSFFAISGENIPILLQNVDDDDTDNEFPDE